MLPGDNSISRCTRIDNKKNSSEAKRGALDGRRRVASTLGFVSKRKKGGWGKAAVDSNLGRRGALPQPLSDGTLF